MPIAGGIARQVTLRNSTTTYPVWSPDGRMIAFASRDGDRNGLWTANVDGREVRRFNNAFPEGPLAWAPGTHIVYPGHDSRDGRFAQIFDLGNEVERPLSSNDCGASVRMASSPDDSKVAVYCFHSSPGAAPFELWIMSLTKTETQIALS